MSKPSGNGKVQLVPAAQDRMRELKAQFDEAHVAGMTALEISDFRTLTMAIQAAGDVIAEQKLLVGYIVNPRKRK